MEIDQVELQRLIREKPAARLVYLFCLSECDEDGTFETSSSDISRMLQLSTREVRTALKNLVEHGFAESESTNKSTKITLRQSGDCLLEATSKTTSKKVEEDKPKQLSLFGEEEPRKEKASKKKAEKQTPKLFTLIRRDFEEAYKGLVPSHASYYFAAKDAGALSRLIRKAESMLDSETGTHDEESTRNLLQMYFVLAYRHGGTWIQQNYGLTLLDGKWNELINMIKSNNGKQNHSEGRDGDHSTLIERLSREARASIDKEEV